jgi:membrane-bound lytic murein transglycosylase B
MEQIFSKQYPGTAVAQWLRYCATNRKVAGSNPDGVMEFFIDINPSDRTMALESTHPLTEMSTGSISWG